MPPAGILVLQCLRFFLQELLINMKKNIVNDIIKWCALLPATMFLLVGCTLEEPEITPQQTCDTQAQVQTKPGCGLVLVLKNKQVLMPINAVPLERSSNRKQQYRINGFTVTEGEQVIIGFNVKSQSITSCSAGPATSVKVTCVVGYQAQP
jgi:hypothetical protein